MNERANPATEPRPLVVAVAHTHWDREWYLPFEVFRLRLAALVEKLLDLLDADPSFHHFMLDGQTICVDDVLALRPDLEARLGRHIAAGRIGVGPWYVLQDEFLVGGESIVRNLLTGLAGARRFGAPMMIGYLPDAFGHVAQMPRILRGFSIDSAVVWRGAGDRAPGAEWRWRALSGAEVLCLYLPGGYGNACRLPLDGGAALARLDGDLAKILPQSRARVLLWMNGVDHAAAEAHLPRLIKTLARARPEIALEQAPLGRAVEAIRARVAVETLPLVEGELRQPSDAAPLLPGVLSARTWQKREHDRTLALLGRFAEPFSTIAGGDARPALKHAWRLLLQCQPHDSICGCSIDEVHRDVSARLRRVRQIARALVRDAVRGEPQEFAVHDGLAILNPHPFAVQALVDVRLRRADDEPFRLVGPSGEVPYQKLPSGRIRVLARDLPPLGIRTLAVKPGKPTARFGHTPRLRLRAIAGGLEITDDKSGLRVVHTFEDQKDRGDLYDFCPVDGDRPRRFDDFRVAAKVVDQRVEIDVRLDHRAKDHRVRARFELSEPPRALFTETPFGWIARSAGVHPVSSAAVLETTPRIALGGHGLHEIELAADGAVLLTLFRAVGFMSRGDLSTRKGHAGYHVATPAAQGRRRLRYRYALVFCDDGVTATARALEPALYPPRGLGLRAATPDERAFLTVTPAAVRLSALKRTEAGERLIVRVLGPERGSVTARLQFHRPVARAFISDLDERLGPEVTVVSDAVDLLVAAQEIVTLAVELADDAIRG